MGSALPKTNGGILGLHFSGLHFHIAHWARSQGKKEKPTSGSIFVYIYI